MLAATTALRTWLISVLPPVAVIQDSDSPTAQSVRDFAVALQVCRTWVGV